MDSYEAGLSKLEKRILNDVQSVVRYARYVLNIDEQGNLVHFLKNESWGINVLAVVGPSVVNSVFFEQVLLLEIGFSHTRPYRKTVAPCCGHARKIFSYRKKVASLSETQMKNAGPCIADILVRIAEEVVSKWSSREPWYFSVGKRVVAHRKGVHFSFSLKDEMLFKGIVVADRKRKNYFDGIVGYVNRVFKRLTYASYPEKQIKRIQSIARTADFLSERIVLACHFQYVKHKIWKQVLFQEMMEAFGLVDMDDVFYFESLLKKGKTTIFFEDASARIIRINLKKEYVTFELIPDDV